MAKIGGGGSASKQNYNQSEGTTPYASTGLSKDFEDLMRGIAPSIFEGLGNAQNLGNASTNVNTPTAQSGGAGQFDLSSLMQAFSAPTAGRESGVNLGALNLPSGAINPQDSEYYKGLTDLFSRNNDKNIAELRARFGGTGTSWGTPALQAESQYRADAIPQLAATLGQARQSEFANLLGERSLLQQGILSGRGQDLEAGLGNLNAGVTERGQDLNAAMGTQGNELQRLMAYANAGLTQRGQDINNSQFNAGQANEMNRFTSNLNYQGNENQIARAMQGLLALLSGGIDLSKLGFGSTSNRSGGQTETTARGGFSFGT